MSTPFDSANYYELLHVSRQAPVEIIKASYRTLMQRLKHHPDLGGDVALAALINEAYAVLTDPARRAAYDMQLDAAAASAQPAQPTRAPMHDWEPGEGCAFCKAPPDAAKLIGEDDACSVCDSPLFAAEKQHFGGVGQRAVERISKRQAIRFYTQWPQPSAYRGDTEDISLNGMRFSTTHELKAGQRIKIVSNVVEAVAQVSHCSEQRRGWRIKSVAGVSFVTLRFVRSVGGFVSDKV